MPAHIGFYVYVFCALVAVALGALGADRLVRTGSALRKRLAAYADLPLRSDFALAERRIAIAERAVDRVPPLLARCETAVHEFTDAVGRLRSNARTLVHVVRRQYRL
ncbi:MAG: hypothetical protein IAI49_15545 [Candidatus Eremiobacteraeota bacterium]|nr:hypothetical protein [Candidatus Eremiobacteraeota bacterium]